MFGNPLQSTGPGPGWGPVRVGARSGLGPIWALMNPYGPIWALMGPYWPLWAHMGPYGSSWTGPDMTKSGLLIQFHTFRVQNLLFDEISKGFCMAFAGEA